ncbi:MAG: hypothetical protein LAT54_09325 [Cryomorphaceae bacterium]|nr:hypothetical protein [Cryomorphaceae bacterium]
MTYTLFYDPKEKEVVKNKIIPELEDIVDDHHPISNIKETLKNGDNIILFASDNQVKEVLPLLSKEDRIVAALPHPDGRDLCTGWGIDYKLDKAIEHLKSTPKDIEIDVLYCNERPIFNNLVIGHAFQLATAKKDEEQSFFTKITQLFN